jgi:hypothetical protein
MMRLTLRVNQQDRVLAQAGGCGKPRRKSTAFVDEDKFCGDVPGINLGIYPLTTESPHHDGQAEGALSVSNPIPANGHGGHRHHHRFRLVDEL